LYQQAATGDPGNNEWWFKMAYVQMVTFDAADQADEWLYRSLELCPNSNKSYCLLGDALVRQAGSAKTGEREALLHSALTNYQQAIRIIGNNSAALRRTYLTAIAKTYLELKDLRRAVDAFESTIPLTPEAEQWGNEEMLARLHADLSNKALSVEHIDRSIKLAPLDKRPALIQLRSQILALPEKR
jgi:tetratricopeptide (TPR) repeat protein